MLELIRSVGVLELIQSGGIGFTLNAFRRSQDFSHQDPKVVNGGGKHSNWNISPHGFYSDSETDIYATHS